MGLFGSKPATIHIDLDLDLDAHVGQLIHPLISKLASLGIDFNLIAIKDGDMHDNSSVIGHKKKEAGYTILYDVSTTRVVQIVRPL